MNKRTALFVAGTFAPVFLFLIPGYAAGTPAKNPSQQMELICLSEQPAIFEGGSATLQAWATGSDGEPISGGPIHFEWEADAGRVENTASGTRWDLSQVKIGAQDASRKVTATVKAVPPGGSEMSCSVEVFIGTRQMAPAPDRGGGGEELLSARHFLLPGATEPSGYGLYSYVLFSAPPRDPEETARYLKTIEATLLILQDVDDYLSRHVRPKSLNLTCIPVNKMPARGSSTTEWAGNVLANYDYAAAQILLSRVQQAHQDGPYLLSVLAPLSEPGMPAHLWENLAGVVPDLAWNWIKFFSYLAAQQRSWSDESLQRFGLQLRNLIAVGGKVTPVTMDALQTAIEYKSKM